MKATDFKVQIKKVAGQLKGLTIQIVSAHSTTPYKNLSSFGQAVLQVEKAGHDISVTQVWTNTGVIKVNCFSDFLPLLTSEIVTAIQFTVSYIPTDFSDYLRTSFGTND